MASSTPDLAKINLDEATAMLRGIIVPMQPKIVSRVQSAGDDLTAVADIISLDPGLSAGILRLVNSPLFNPQASLSSIEEAVNLLGINSTINVMNAVLLKMAANREFHRIELLDYWESSRDVAYAAAMAARQLNIGMVDETYCLGLFHNIGMPLIQQKFGDYFEFLRSLGGEELIAAENGKYRCDHATIGYYIAKGMQLDENVCIAIREHHDPFLFFSKKDDMVLTMAALLKFAEISSDEAQRLTGVDNYHEWQQIKDRVLEIIGLSELDFVDLAEIVAEQTQHRH